MTQDIVKREEEILKFWKKHNVFRKSLAKNKRGKPRTSASTIRGKRFVFYEGPPTANAPPALHHVLARAFKDLIPRFRTMQGFFVERRAGWDTHGLPVELQVEKALNFKSKRDIETYGIDKFNAKCRESVWQFKSEWEHLTKRIGFWLDMDTPYISYTPEYIETLWWIIKRFHDSGLLYKAHRVAPYCPRCGTGLSSHEVALGYKKVKENSVFMRLEVKPGLFILSWTTTPWTLPGNVALAVNPKLEYSFVKHNGATYIVARAVVKRLFSKNTRIIKTVKGDKLIGLKYRPLFDIKSLQNPKSHKVYPASFVTDNEGTGIVHTAVMYGEDDYKLGIRHNLPQRHTVDETGRFQSLALELQGLPVKAPETEHAIMEHLKKHGSYFKEELFEHDYPFCWRCSTPLLYYALDSWFVKTTAVKRALIKNNRAINWTPEHIGTGRFGNFLADVKDWVFSRSRYWGTPLPVWTCRATKMQNSKCKMQNDNSKFKIGNSFEIRGSKFKIRGCGKFAVIGSYDELVRRAVNKIAARKAARDPHRPQIDQVILRCDCGGEMRREPYVTDVWFDSGAMPFAQAHFPFAFAQIKNSKLKIKNDNGKLLNYDQKQISKLLTKLPFPADYIAEGVDQTRGWFYTLLAISTLLGFKAPYKNVISLGLLLDEHGKKMSKSKGNIIDPWQTIEKFGADAVRWYFFSINQPGMAKRFAAKDITDKYRSFLQLLINSVNFFKLYTGNQMQSAKVKMQNDNAKFKSHLDSWIISRLNATVAAVTQGLENYQVLEATRALELFMSDLSHWYIRRSRRRFQQPSSAKDLKAAQQTLGYVLWNLLRLAAPFVPFTTEWLYQDLKKFFTDIQVKSIHLAPWPKAGQVKKQLERSMEVAREVASLGLAARKAANIKVRQPLSRLTVFSGRGTRLNPELISLIADEVNVREVILKMGRAATPQVKLDTRLTPELIEEGKVRDLIREIQDARKKMGLEPSDRIELALARDNDIAILIPRWKKFIAREIGARRVSLAALEIPFSLRSLKSKV